MGTPDSQGPSLKATQRKSTGPPVGPFHPSAGFARCLALFVNHNGRGSKTMSVQDNYSADFTV
eukprot:177412-Pelagomonas_calceolata.AAC.2